MKYSAILLFCVLFVSLSAVPSQAHENYILNFDRNFDAKKANAYFDAKTANALWPLIANSGDLLLFTHYLEYFPDSEHVDDAKTANALWPLIANSGDPLLFTHYLEYFPDSEHVEDARRKLDDFKGTDAGFWRSIGEDTNLASERYINYLKRYPDGKYAEIARKKIQDYREKVANCNLMIIGVGGFILLMLYLLSHLERYCSYLLSRLERYCSDDNGNGNENRDCMP